ADFGLTAFIGADRKESIDCVLKRLYSDFIVQEIDAAGVASRLVTFDEARATSKTIMAGDGKLLDESVVRPACVTDTFVAACDAVFERREKEGRMETADLDKPSRTSLHGYVRSRYGGEVESETSKDGDAIVVKRRKPGKRKRWARDTPPHTHFTMAKENKETSYAIGIVAKMSGCNPGLFKTCGLKDRRAVTAQRVSAFQVDIDKLLNLNSRLRGIVLYDMSYEKEGVKTGSHWGNRFSIVLRDIDRAAESTLAGRLAEWAEKGFINYFGTQRFGSCETRTADVGRLILQRNWKDAVGLILGGAGRNGQDSVQGAIELWKASGDATAACKLLQGAQSFASVEGSILRSLSKGKTWQEAVLWLPPNIRSIYVHAYQSLLWNKLASERILANGMAVLEGDIGADSVKLETEGASPFDVHVPLPNSACADKEGYVFAHFKAALEADGLSWDSFRTLEKNFSLGDASRLALRPLFVRPGSVAWKFVRGKGPSEQIQRDLTYVPDVALESENGVVKEEENKDIKKEGEDTKNGVKEETQAGGDVEKRLALWMRFDLPGGVYATVALREITACDMGKRYQKELNFAGERAEEAEPAAEAGEEEEVVKEEVLEDEGEPVKKEPKLEE
ncbi:hypothetical protein PFISCL1PPCAC_17066, partial [Pristionchus fissidentatus]